MRIDVVTIFPDYLQPLRLSLPGKAIEQGVVEVNIHDLRDSTHDRHRTVDDTPYGGGPGMVLKPEPWGESLDRIIESGPPDVRPTLIIPTPSGAPFTQQTAAELAQGKWLIFACGRYEGIDARVGQHYTQSCDVRQVSIGDYVLAGGEVAALVISEAVIRLLPGVLGNSDSAGDDSFAPDRVAGALEGPIYTKPAVWRGLEVPQVLMSGDHGAIAAWRVAESLRRTREFRPELTDVAHLGEATSES
ncbi:MAG: tRNA (guanosine(37)-N1)-methyltransferase TrmD [Candidatus Nanopelagicales bacterium]